VELEYLLLEPERADREVKKCKVWSRVATLVHLPASHQSTMGRQMYLALLVSAAHFVHLSSALAATRLFPQLHFSTAESHPRHFEAYIVNDLETDACLYVSLGTTQPHKELTRALGRGDLYHTERSTFDSGTARRAGKLERIKVFSNDTQVLRDYSVALCGRGDDRRTFPFYDALLRDGMAGEGATSNEMTEGDLPPLEIRPIFQSGNPENRVDLVFFGDGCEFLG